MKYHKFLLSTVYIILLVFSCDKQQVVELCEPILLPEPYEEIYTSFNLPDLGIQVMDTSSICEEVGNRVLELESGGPAGFHLKTGFKYNNN